MKGDSDKQKRSREGESGRKNKRKLPPHLWKKGQSGNPKGRPPMGHSIAETLRWIENLKAPETLEASVREIYGLGPEVELTVKKVILLSAMMLAMKGDRAHIQFWAERTEGRMPETLNVTQENKLRVVEQIVTDEEAAGTGEDAGGPGGVTEAEAEGEDDEQG